MLILFGPWDGAAYHEIYWHQDESMVIWGPDKRPIRATYQVDLPANWCAS